MTRHNKRFMASDFEGSGDMKRQIIILLISALLILGVFGALTYIALTRTPSSSSTLYAMADKNIPSKSTESSAEPDVTIEADESISILFVGNSLTYTGDIPMQVQALAKQHGIEVTYTDISWPSARLDELTEEAVSEMQKKQYDYVVLQDRSYLPLYEIQAFFDNMRTLCDEARKNGASPVLYNPAWKVYNPIFTNTIFDDEDGNEMGTGEERRKLCTEAYEQAAHENGTVMVNAGDAWLYAYENISGISLFQDDDHHPNYAGAYFTACVFVSTLFDIQISDVSDMYKGDDAVALGQAAWEFVLDYKGSEKPPEEVQ